MDPEVRMIMKALKRPFNPSAITWKPQSVSKEGSRAMAIAYADVRAYMNRLDEVCGMDWSVTYTPWGERIVCHLTIYGVTRSSTGESDAQSEKQEIGGTSAEAQAFKRACAMFGLGRYLYSLPSMWVDYDKEKRGFTAQGQAKLDAMIASHYKRSQATDADEDLQPPAEPPAQPRPENGIADLVGQLNSIGEEVYAAEWPSVSKHNVMRISNGELQEPKQLSEEQLKKLIAGLQAIREKRKNAKVVA